MFIQQNAAGQTAAIYKNAFDKQANHTAASRQRQVILKHLQQGNRLTTIYAREVLGIMHPAARVMELRKRGHNIVTNRLTEEDVTGRPHRVAEYVLFHGKVLP